MVPSEPIVGGGQPSPPPMVPAEPIVGGYHGEQVFGQSYQQPVPTSQIPHMQAYSMQPTPPGTVAQGHYQPEGPILSPMGQAPLHEPVTAGAMHFPQESMQLTPRMQPHAVHIGSTPTPPSSPPGKKKGKGRWVFCPTSPPPSEPMVPALPSTATVVAAVPPISPPKASPPPHPLPLAEPLVTASPSTVYMAQQQIDVRQAQLELEQHLQMQQHQQQQQLQMQQQQIQLQQQQMHQQQMQEQHMYQQQMYQQQMRQQQHQQQMMQASMQVPDAQRAASVQINEWEGTGGGKTDTELVLVGRPPPQPRHVPPPPPPPAVTQVMTQVIEKPYVIERIIEKEVKAGTAGKVTHSTVKREKMKKPHDNDFPYHDPTPERGCNFVGHYLAPTNENPWLKDGFFS